MKNKLFNNKGMTLVEVIITVAILGIIIAFMFTFFHFNYTTFCKSNTSYNVQTNLNEVLRTIDEELRFADNINIPEINNESEFDNEKNYFYLEDSVIKSKKANKEPEELIINDIIITKLFFKLINNNIDINIIGKYTSNNKEFNIQYNIELLNIKDEINLEGSVIEYYEKKEMIPIGF